MNCVTLRLLKGPGTCKFKVLAGQLRFSLALGIKSISLSGSDKEKEDFRNSSILTEKQQEIVLNQLNRCKEQPLSIRISQKKLTAIHKFIEQNNSFTRIAQLYELNGFEQETANKLCKQILKSLNSPLQDKKSNRLKTNNYLSPLISSSKKEEIQRIVGIDVGSSGVSWTKMDCLDNCISNWHMIEFLPGQELKSVVNIYSYVRDFIDQIPTADIYVMENNNWSVLNPQMSLRNHVRDAQITAILTALLNSERASNSLTRESSVYFMRSRLASRLFSTLIGNEKVSSQQSVEKMFQGEFPEFCSSFHMNSVLKDFYFSLERSLREDLCQSLLLTLTCRELLVHNKPVLLKSVKKST